MRAHHLAAWGRIAFIIGCAVMAFSSCRKTPSTIGNGFIDDNNYINVYETDTVRIVCHSYLDSIGSKNVRFGLLGALNDPVFGQTEAGFYTQFRFSSAGQLFGSNVVTDSVVLQLAISNLYGDTTTLQTVRVYELADTLSSTESYYSYTTIETGTTDLANGYQFTPRTSTSGLIIGDDTITQPVIRIPIDNSVGTQLMQLDSSAYSHPDVFQSLFKGLYVCCDAVSQNGAVCSINLTNNTLTRLQVYYHEAETPENILRYDYYVTSAENYFNHFSHDYTLGQAEFVSQVLQGETALGQQKIYVQAMGGVRTRILFPNLSHWTDSLSASHVVINEAKLVLPASPDVDTAIFTAPQKLVLVGFNADSTTFILPDNYEGDLYFGGSYDAAKQTVTFRITQYFQKVLLGKTGNHGLSLGIDGASYNPSRWVINGPEASQGEGMRLEVTYSVVNE